MSRSLVGTIFAILCILVNVYIVWKGQTPEGMTATQQARLKVVGGVLLLLAFIALTFGEALGL
ncbi:Uncharacterised protein [Aerococcus viridans]|uniref:Uncharacterized protein n=2 Tax=Aerococcus viridans TaxID=1377 RepID=A0AAU8UJY9_9LACT|nr:hypothetical protein [Aerococcus viridans]AMC00232.1 hypothetical protein AWM76_00920 [Aerococcus viridans]EFG50641.1 hypothetical protein HMPREF0061_0022 [Aerococcus viridans ATCC 11563 = CCUG 4311]SUU10069.1 Uncharacterised protein [Aerococcus viridans]